jgi:hypothetical protein
MSSNMLDEEASASGITSEAMTEAANEAATTAPGAESPPRTG